MVGCRYRYTEDLRQLDQCSKGRRLPSGLGLEAISTPLVHVAWVEHLKDHPDREYVNYVTKGIREGFRVGCRTPSKSLRSASKNMGSVRQSPEVVANYIRLECERGTMAGPLPPGEARQIHINRFGIIPKSGQPGRWRLIVDLSHPDEKSVNDGICREWCSLSYATIDEAVRTILRLGRGTLLAKVDLESAYRMIPVHPEDRHLLGMMWEDKVYVDKAVPFGLRSAPKIFNAVADALMWILGKMGVRNGLHYLDDYLLFGLPKSKECEIALAITLRICQLLGAKVAQRKVEGPSTVLVFLGIQLDTEKLEVRLPEDKLGKLLRLLRSWQGRRRCTKRELLSLLGHQHACRVIPAGRSFLRRMIETSTLVKKLHYRIRLNVGFRSDLQWWRQFAERWNGTQMMTAASRVASFTLTSDASGSWGCGAFTSEGAWFQLRWPQSWEGIHITVKELVPIVVACAVWGNRWRGRSIRVRCDNAAVVAIIKSGSSKHHRAMHLMRCLAFLLAHFNISLLPEHIPGRLNMAADNLSRDDLASFRSQVPKAQRLPTAIPAELVTTLILEQPDWISLRWRTLFDSILRKV